MKELTQQEICQVAGAEQLVITQYIPTADISAQCISTLCNLFNGQPAASEENMVVQLLAGCTFYELDLVGDRLDEADVVKIEYI